MRDGGKIYMTDLTLQEKKQLLLDAITTVDQITEEVKDNYPFDDTEGEHLNGGESWDAKNYKTFLIRKLGAIEYELQNMEEETTTNTTTDETNTEQVTQQEQDNKDEEEKQENKDEKEEEEKVKP